MPAPSARHWTNLTRAFFGILLLRVALFGAGTLLSAKPDPTQIAETQAICTVFGVAVGLVWLHRAWARVPRPHRRAYDGRGVEPGEAIWKLFIPVYGALYWLFIASTGLCGALEHQLKRYSDRKLLTPSTLGFVACLVQLVPIANLVVSPLLWGMFMARIDVVQAKAARLDVELVPAPLGWLKVLGIFVGAIVAVWAMLGLSFLAVWHFVSPDWPMR